MSVQIAVVHEAAADFETATELADRAMCAAISWLDEELLGYERTWLDQSGGGKPLTWKGIKQLALEAGIIAWGHFANEPALPDAAAARRAIIFLRNEYPELWAIVLVRDRDDQPERRGALEQARRDNHAHVVIVVGFAVVDLGSRNETGETLLTRRKQEATHETRAEHGWKWYDDLVEYGASGQETNALEKQAKHEPPGSSIASRRRWRSATRRAYRQG